MKINWANILNGIIVKSGITALKGFVLAVLAFALWSFAGKRQRSRVVNKIDIQIENEAENHFVNAAEIESSITLGKNNMVHMRWFDSVSLYKMERKIEKIDFVKKAQVSHDLGGNLSIRVFLVKPIARIISGGSDLDRYLGSEGEVLPTSEKYASKVITIDGPGSRKLAYQHTQKDTSANQIIDMVQFIESDPFWKAQIAHIYLDQNGEVTLYPQVGQQLIEFGQPTNVKAKFKKLLAFYERIAPVKGWSNYQKISIKFRNQIVCQKTS